MAPPPSPGRAASGLALLSVALLGCGRLGFDPVLRAPLTFAPDGALVDGGAPSDGGPASDGSPALPRDPCEPLSPVPPTAMAIADTALYATTDDAPFVHAMRLLGASGQAVWRLVSTPPPGLSLDASGVVRFTPSGVGAYELSVSVTDGSGATVDAIVTLHVRADRLCVFRGTESAAFDDPRNWSFCGGAVPGLDDWIAVDGRAASPVRVASSTVVRGIGASDLAGGTIEVGSGATLELTDAARTFQSDVRLAGASPACTDCVVLVGARNGGDDASIVNDATLVLDPGIALWLHDHHALLVGSMRPAETGHLVACGMRAAPDAWPVISSPPLSDPGHYGIRVSAGAGAASSISIDGLVLRNIHHGDENDAFMVDLVEGWVVERLDHLRLDGFYPGYDVGVRIEGCGTGELRDAYWDDLELELDPTGGTINVRAGCDPGVRICIPNATGAGAGPLLEQDPFDVVDWGAGCR